MELGASFYYAVFTTQDYRNFDVDASGLHLSRVKVAAGHSASGEKKLQSVISASYSPQIYLGGITATLTVGHRALMNTLLTEHEIKLPEHETKLPDDKIKSAIFPRLKNGIYVSPVNEVSEQSITLATSLYCVEIHHKNARAIVEQCTGVLTVEEIAHKLDLSLETISEVIKKLQDANFIDTVRNTITLNNRFHSSIASRAANTQDQSKDAAFSQMQKRLAPELSYATWIDGVRDGGVDVMTARQNFGIEIIGNSRTATLIYSILLASGVTNTRISLSTSYKHPTVIDSDLGSGTLRTTDLGLNFKNRLEELSREWSLFPVASSYALAQRGAPKQVLPEKNLRIICGLFEKQFVEHLVKDGHDHFFVGRVPGHGATIGPLVQPGKTPCRHCLTLVDAIRNGSSELAIPTTTSDEFPIAIAHHVAALAAQAALKFIDTGRSELFARQLYLDFLTPFEPQLYSFSRHPDCDCLWPKDDFLM